MVNVKAWTPPGTIAILMLIVHPDGVECPNGNHGAHGPEIILVKERDRVYPENAKRTAGLMISASMGKNVPHLAIQHMGSVHMNWILQENIARALGIASGTVWRLVVEMANVLTVSSSKLSLLSRKVQKRSHLWFPLFDKESYNRSEEACKYG